MKGFLIIVLLILSLIVFFYSNKEGFTPGDSMSTGSQQSASTKGNENGNSTLDKFTNALITAFSPPPTEPKKPVGKPAWTNVKQLNDQTSALTKTPASCKSVIQEAVNPLPIDDQAKTTIADHSKTIISALDAYELQLKKIENILNKSNLILALNKNVDSVVNLGIPSISNSYDEQSNTLINISVVKGISGDKGDKPDRISGIGVDGDIGAAGVDGINPIGNTIDELPYWGK